MAADSFKPFVVAFGSSDFFLDRDIERVKQAKRRVICLDADAEDLTDVQLVELCGIQSDEPRTIIVDNAQKVKGTKALAQFIEDRDVADTSLVLAVILRSDKLPEVWSAAASKSKCAERKAFKDWDVDAYTSFIAQEAKRFRVSLGKDVAAQLLQYVGKDLYRLSNEVRKLAVFVGPPGTVQKEHVALITTPSPEAKPFQVAEAVMNKTPKKAMGLFSVLYSNSGDDCLIPVVRSLMQQTEKAVMIRSLLDKGVAEDEIATLMGMKPWIYKNSAAPMARKHDLKTLIGHMGRLCKLDADVKGPSRSRTLVELAMLSIAQ